MGESVNDFLDNCSAAAERTLEEDKQNQLLVENFWNFAEVIRTISEAIRESVVYNSGTKTIDMERYYTVLEENNILELNRNMFSQEQIDGIAGACFPSYIFSMYVCKGRFPEGEAAIQRNLKYWNEYEYVCTNFFDNMTQFGSMSNDAGFRRPM